MENSLAKYLNKDLRSAISGLTVVQGTAKDSGNVYYCVELSFINGYVKRIFLRNDEAFAWANAFELVQAQQQVDVRF